MGRIDDLVKQLCPDGVEYTTLGEVCEIGTGSSNTKDGLEEGLYPFYTRGRTVLRKNEYEFEEEAVVTAGDGDVGKVIHYVKGKYALHQRAYRFKPKESLMCRFLFHYMRETFQQYVCGNAVASSVSSLRKPKLMVYPIPLPPLSIQQQIVEVLDLFTDMIDNLQTELGLREKQMTYYREKLLSFEEEEVEYTTLGEACICVTGGDAPSDCVKGQQSPTKEYPYPVYSNGDSVYGYCSNFKIDKEAVTVSSIGNIGTAYYREPYFTPIIRLKTFIPKDHSLNVKFLYYVLSAMTFTGTCSTLSSMKAADFKKRSIPLPPLARQEKIVEVLDTFTDLIANIKQEIELRQKQYEFYREKLLTFQPLKRAS